VANILCLDFDDTIAVENMARRVFERFAGPRWAEVEADSRRQGLSIEQRRAAGLDCIEATDEELRAFARETGQVRPGFMELIDWATWNNWQPIVVSNGFDFYVDPVLDALGLDRLMRHCGRTRFDYRWRVRYDSPRGIELAEGFKLSYATAFRSAGDFVVYAGDGVSDVPAASLAGAAFARDALWDRLQADHPCVHPFETFHDVIAVLDREAEGWLNTFAAGGS